MDNNKLSLSALTVIVLVIVVAFMNRSGYGIGDFSRLTPTPTLSSPAVSSVKIYVVAIGDEGKTGRKIGCGDSLIPLEISVPYTQGILRSAVENLLSFKSQGEEKYNIFDKQDLKIDVVKVENGRATINLRGKIQMGGVCDIPRFKEQLLSTVKQFPSVNQVDVFINNVPMDEALSLK